MKNNIAIIVYTSDRNNAMWDIVMFFLKKYWPDCPYLKVLLTDTDRGKKGKKLGFDRVIECDADWPTMMKTAIRSTNASFFITWMDDYCLYDYVDTQLFENAIQFAIHENALNVRLVPARFQKNVETRKGYAKIELGHAYSLSTHIGIWSSQKFIEVVDDKWSAWEFERIGSITIDKSNKVYCVTSKELPYIEAVRNGKFFPEGVDLISKNGFTVEDTGKPVMSKMDLAIINLKASILDINPDFIQKIQNFCFRLMGKHR